MTDEKDPIDLAFTRFAEEHPDIAYRDIALKAVFFAGFRAGVEQSTASATRLIRKLLINDIVTDHLQETEDDS